MPNVSERLRAFVRSRVRRGGKHYEWGNAARLAEHLGTDHGWVTLYTDNPPARHADIDQGIAICDFYGVNLYDFRRREELPDAAPRLTEDQREAAYVAELYLKTDKTLRPSLREHLETLARIAGHTVDAPQKSASETTPARQAEARRASAPRRRRA